jgi:protocatechuate 3,4-dioxygenase beta subunit
MRMSLLRLTFLLTLAVAVNGRGPLLAQLLPPATGSGFISGQVVEGGTTRPVPGATVALSASPRMQAREVIADSQGRYVFSGLPAGEFRLTARKPGWLAGAYGLTTPLEAITLSDLGGPAPGEVLRLAEGERGRASVPVWRNAIIRGRVTDESGEPLPGARVRAMYWMPSRGHRILNSAGDWGIADDRGEFTMSVRPGEYMLSATSEQVRIVNGRSQVFRQTFFPRSFTTSNAAVIAVKSGEERNGIAMQLPLEPAFRLTGVVNAVDAGRMPQRLQLLTEGGDATRFPARVPDAQGRFVFDYIPAGRYVLRSASLGFGSQEPSQSTELWVQSEVDVTDRDLALIVNAHRPLLVSGRVRFDSATGDGASIAVRLFRDGELPLSDVSPAFFPTQSDGTFTLAVTPGKYVASVGGTFAGRGANPAGGGAPRTWNLRDATIGGSRDAADLPFAITSDLSGLELTLTDAATTLRGRATSRQGSVRSALVIVFPVEERFWEFIGGRRIAIRRLSADGTFELRNLPEGNYFLAAVHGGPNEYEARNPALLEALARTARRVTVLDGQTTTQDIELITAPATNVARLSLVPGIVATERAILRDVPATSAAWATISGTVLAAGSNAPIAGARVGLTPGVGGAANAGGAYTDSLGRFTLVEVPAGQHTLYVTRPPYVSTVYGAATPADPGTPVTVAGGQRLSDLKIAVLKGAAISGTVKDQNGQPLAGVQVSIRAYRWTARGRELTTPRSPTIFGPATTDVLGQYRTYGLAPADYVVQASFQVIPTAMPLTTQADVDAATKSSTPQTAARSPVPVTYTPMFYPNTPDPSAAQAVRLGAGDEMTIDFQFQLLPTATVSGIVRTVDGAPFNRISVNLSQNDPLGPPLPRSRFGSADSTGAFTITDVPPGRYLMTTSQIMAGSSPLAGALELFVDRDVSGIVFDLVPMSTVTGTVRGELLSVLRQPTVRLSLSPLPGTVVAPNTSRSSTIGPDGRFSIPNVPPGRYRFEVTGPNTIAKPRTASQRVQGIETVDAGLVVKGGEALDVDVEFVTSEATVAGRLRDRSGQPVTSPYVVLFSKEPAAWTPPSRRIFGVRPDQNGRYLFPDVPAGDYLVTTLGGVEAGEWFDPSVLAKLAPAASPVTVRRGDKLEVDLEIR